MRKCPIILTFVRHYLPGYKSGGPIRTIANLVEALGKEIDFRIVTSDRDATDTRPYPGLLSTGQWEQVGKAQVLYLAPGRRGLRGIAGILRDTPHDTLYLNSFFDPVFSLRPLLARRFGLAPQTRCIVAPRGEFSPGALKLKALKKRVFIGSSRALGFHSNLVWQASSEHEAEAIKRKMGTLAMDIRVAINLPAPAGSQTAPTHRQRAKGEPLRTVFLSRISPMKNLEFAFEVLRRVQSRTVFDIYGPVRDDNYWTRCKDLMARLPEHVEACYRGSIDHDRVAETLSAYDLFFLPTRGENYGHVILEALTVGTPVLIADTTPWRGLADIGVGWDLSLSRPETFAEKIEQMAHMPPAEQSEMRARVSSFARRCLTDSAAIDVNRDLFMS
ncbi:MAG: glycosyltransferase family 4 protein [Mesorhizobium sp.]